MSVIKIIIEIDADQFIEALNEEVPDDVKTGSPETQETLQDYADGCLDELRDAVEECLLGKLIEYHSN